MGRISGKRVLIVEDNCLIGEMIADTISEAGGEPIGPLPTESEALIVVEDDPSRADAAILDVNLEGVSFDLAARLRSLGVPFIFATGHGRDVPEEFRDVPLCQKPYTITQLLRILDQAIAQSDL